MGRPVEEGRGVSVVGRLQLVSYGVSLMGPCRTDGSGGYGGAPAPLCRLCLGDGASGGWRAEVGCVGWSAWKPMEALRTLLR